MKGVTLALSLGLVMSSAACGGGTTGSGGAGGEAGNGGAAGMAGSGGAAGMAGSGGAAGMAGAGGTDTCGMVAVPGKTIKGKVTYTGTVDAGDTLLVAAVKDGKPGIPSGFNSYKDPTFPLDYEITNLPVDKTAGFSEYGILAYVDHGSNNLTGPGPEDPQAAPMMLLKVTECEGASIDFEIPPMP